MKKTILSLALLASLTLTGCASSLGGATYSRSEARGELSVRIGTVVAVREVQIEGNGGAGALTGAALGGIAGASLDGGRTGAALGILGLVGGAMLGDKVGKAATGAPGLEVTVQLSTGQVVAVVQERDAQLNLKAGDKVRLLGSGRATRVGPL